MSLLQVIQRLEETTKKSIELNISDWRTGDQKYYVSNISRFQKATGWKPRVKYQDGIDLLSQWLEQNITIKKKKEKEITIPLAN